MFIHRTKENYVMGVLESHELQASNENEMLRSKEIPTRKSLKRKASDITNSESPTKKIIKTMNKPSKGETLATCIVPEEIGEEEGLNIGKINLGKIDFHSRIEDSLGIFSQRGRTLGIFRVRNFVIRKFGQSF